MQSLVCTSVLYILGIVNAAGKALDALKRVRAGKAANNERKRTSNELSSLFNFHKKKKINRSKPAWRHKFVCLAFHDQEKIPATDAEKEELYQAGLGEKEVIFPSLDLSGEEFRQLLYEHFPRLRNSGGYQLLKGLPNCRFLEVLSRNVHASASLLKQRVGTSRTYIRPLQADLDLTPLEPVVEAVS